MNEKETVADILDQMETFAEIQIAFSRVPTTSECLGLIVHQLSMRLREAYKREMDEAAEHINDYLQEIPTMARPHNWLIRNGYKDTSYQASVYGQEIYEEDKNANHD